MTFDFNKDLLLLDGTPAKDYVNEKGVPVEVGTLTMAKCMARNIANVNKNPEPQKLAGWALSLYKDGTVTLDKPDQTKFRKLIESMDGVSALITARLLDDFDEQQDLDKKGGLKAVPAASNGQAQPAGELVDNTN